MANNIKSISTSTQEVNYTFDTVKIMKKDTSSFKEKDVIKVRGYYSVGDLQESELIYDVMSYDNWLSTLPEDMRYASYTSGWFGYKYIKIFVDEYGNHTLSNGLVAVLRVKDIVYAEQYGCIGDGSTLDNTAIRHLFGLNKRNITIKFQKGKTYVIGTEKFNAMYYDENKFNLIKDNNLYTNKNVCIVNEYFTQGGQMTGGWCYHIKPCLNNIENVIIDGSGSTIFIPDNQFNATDNDDATPFSWLEMNNYINGLEIKNFIINANGLNQIKKGSSEKAARTTNHGLFYGGGSLHYVLSLQEYKNQFKALGVNISCYDKYTNQLCNVKIHDNTIKNTGTAVPTNDMGGDGILIIPPPIVENIEVYNNTFFNMGRWVFAIDLVNDKKDCTNIKFYNNTADFDETNVVNGKYRGLGWIDFECTRRFIDLEVSNNKIRGCCGWAFNGGTDAVGENIIIKNNNLDFPALSYYSSYLYDFYFYNLNANNLIIDGNTIINKMNNDNSRSLGYQINNLTIKNNRFYKVPMIFTSVSGVVLIENNTRITENDEPRTDNTLVVEFNKHSYQTHFNDNYAQIIFVNNLGGFGGSFTGTIDFPKNYSFLIQGNKNATYNTTFINSNKPRIDITDISNDYNSLRCSNIYKYMSTDNLSNFKSYGYVVEKGEILARNNARELIIDKSGYLPVTQGAFGLASADINTLGSSIDIGKNQLFYTEDNVYLPLNSGTLGSDPVTHTEGTVKSGDVALKYLYPKATYITSLYEIYGNVDLTNGKVAEFNASNYTTGNTSFTDTIGNYLMNFDNNGNESNNDTNIVNGEFITKSSGDKLSGTCFTLFEGIDFGDEFTLVIYGSGIQNMGVGLVESTSDAYRCLFYYQDATNLTVLNKTINVTSISGKKMFTFIFSKGKEPVVYCNTTRISISTNTVSKNIDYTTNFKLVIGRIPYLDFGYYKYAASKFRDVIVYNRRLNYNEIQELYNSLSV